MAETSLEFKLVGLGEAIDPEHLAVDGGLDDSPIDPVQKFFQQIEYPVLAKFNGGWDEELGGALLSKTESVHADGVEVEKCGQQVWKWTYKNGALAGAELEDPDLGTVHFDKDGNEIAA